MKKVIISGVAGYIGSVLARRLLEKNYYVVGIDNLLYQQDSLLSIISNKRFTFINEDVTLQAKSNKINDHLLTSDVMIPLAAIVGMPACDKYPKAASEVNFEHVKYWCNIKKQHQLLIYPNTNSGYGNSAGNDGYCTEKSPLVPLSHYGITKCIAEEEVLKCGGISLRLATVFGISPRFRRDLLVNDFVCRAIGDGYIVLFEKNYRRNFIHVEDVCGAFEHMIENYTPGQVYNVGLSSANLTKNQLCEEIKKYLPNFSIQFDEFTKDKDQRDYIVSSEKLEKSGWQPYFSLQDGIEEIIKAYPILFPRLPYANI